MTQAAVGVRVRTHPWAELKKSSERPLAGLRLAITEKRQVHSI